MASIVVRESPVSGVGMFATQLISKDQQVLVECPFFQAMSQEVSDHFGKFQVAGKIDYPGGTAMVNRFVEEINTTKDHDELSPGAHDLLLMIDEVAYSGLLEEQSPSIQEKWWALHDANHSISQKGTIVRITGLRSDKGKDFNGLTGKTTLRASDGRWGVEVKAEDGTSTSISVKVENLKSPGGIFQTNSYGGSLYEMTSIANHSCTPNAKVSHLGSHQHPAGQVVIVALCDIPQGEEVFTDYAAGQMDTKKFLARKYCIHCCCQRCAGVGRLGTADGLYTEVDLLGGMD